MKRHAIWALLMLLLLAGAAGAAGAEAFSFPPAGVRLAAEPGWTVITPQTLAENGAFIAQLGADADVLAADYAADHTVFEAFLPGGAQVRLTAVRTEESETWARAERMTAAQMDALKDAFTRAPYQDTAWAEQLPGWLAYDWSLEAGGVPIAFSAITTVENGLLITLTASGADIGYASLRDACARMRAALSFFDILPGAAIEDAPAGIVPEPIDDDGTATPLAMVAFDGVTYEDTTTLTLKTLPGAEVLLRTATDSLRGRADADGNHSFQVSTRRQSVYTYTLTAQAEGRRQSQLELAVDRRLTEAAKQEAYRKSAQQLYAYGYNNLVGAPEAYAEKPVTFRGRVSGFAELGGFPCVLIYTDNPGRGQWRNPIWVMLTEAAMLAIEDIRTIYGDLRGDAMPYTDEDGVERTAPVVIARSILE